ncbi:Os01g0145700 [Oryza sativa Japonica Group]|jgi:hypothetical protein|nr:uncharacterized protein LOC107276225 [Oryza sativa Japonica Group]BAS70365.1 Os01g0145700 [Oryza sativa Japonica Group]
MAPQLPAGADRREPEATLGAVGIATVSAATAALAAALEPPPGSLVADTFYRLTLTGAFLGGVALVGASIWVADNPAARRAAGKKLLYTAVPPLLAAVGISVAALLW